MKTVLYVYNSGDDIARAKVVAAERNACKTHGVNHRWSNRTTELRNQVDQQHELARALRNIGILATAAATTTLQPREAIMLTALQVITNLADLAEDMAAAGGDDAPA